MTSLQKSPLRIVVLGGGVSGLASAQAALSSSKSSIKSVTLLESSSRIGGWVNTVKFDDGCTFELGPRSFRTAGLAGRNTLELVSIAEWNYRITERSKAAFRILTPIVDSKLFFVGFKARL